MMTYGFKVYSSITYFILAISNVKGQSRTNFRLSRFEVCKSDDPIVKYSGNVTTQGNKQYLDFDMTLPFDADDNAGVTCLIQHALDGKTFIPLFNITEKNACKSGNKYLGEYIYEIERSSGMTPGVCPVRAGRYRLHHFELHFDKIALQTFPFGRLRIWLKFLDNRRKKSVLCWFQELENMLV